VGPNPRIDCRDLLSSLGFDDPTAEGGFVEYPCLGGYENMLAMWVGVGVSSNSPGSRLGWRASRERLGVSLSRIGDRETGGWNDATDATVGLG